MLSTGYHVANKCRSFKLFDKNFHSLPLQPAYSELLKFGWASWYSVTSVGFSSC